MGYEIQRGNVQEPLRFLMVSSVDHIAGVTGLVAGVDLTVTIAKSNQAAFAAPAGAVLELGNGVYYIAPNAIDANTLGVLSLHAVGTGCDPTDDTYDVVDYNPTLFTPTVPTAASAVAGVSFGAVWKQVRLYVPGAPVFLVRNWVEDAWKTLCDQRGWNWLTTQGQIAWADARQDLAVTTTWGSATVTSVGLFSSADVGRQFMVGTYPIYTIIASTDANTITLDQPYHGQTVGAVTATILDAYAVMPASFGRFAVVVDPTNQRFVPWWATQEELALIDPTRSSLAGTSRLLVAASPSTNPATRGQTTYEYWPKPTARGAFQYYGVDRPAALTDTTIFRGVLAQRTDVLVDGALAKAALWPGTGDVKNPYFNIALHRQHKEDFERGCLQLDLRDDDVSPQSWSTIPWHLWNGYRWAYDTHLLQATDATLADYASV